MIPFALNQVTQTGHEVILAALAQGASQVVPLLDPEKADEAQHLAAQVQLANLLAEGAGVSGPRALVVETRDPDALEEAVWAEAPAAVPVEPITPLGDHRSVTRLSLTALAAASGGGAEPQPLPADLFPSGPPYGAVDVNADACTLCLACVSLCPAGALLDNPDAPQLSFIEDRCLQCGVCQRGCPENAITLSPRYRYDEGARQRVVKNEEEPFACVECGKLFGVKSTIDRIAEKLAGKHWMYVDDARVRMLQMCDTCRISAQYHSDNNPFRMGDRPRVRTTDDYLAGAVKDDD
jgi:ferredoxin